MDGSGGKIHSFCAWYSLRMSFWIVPRSFVQGTRRRSAMTRYIAHSIAAGELVRIDGEIEGTGRPRYIVGWMPRVNGYSPGAPRSFPGSNAGTSRGVYSRWTGINEVVVNSFFRSGTLSRERLSAPFSHAFTRSRRASSGSFPMGFLVE